jgi:hypothetical protein
MRACLLGALQTQPASQPCAQVGLRSPSARNALAEEEFERLLQDGGEVSSISGRR